MMSKFVICLNKKNYKNRTNVCFLLKVCYNSHGGKMKQYLIFGIFLFVLNRQKTTAKEIAECFEISTRTVYRYIDCLCMSGVKITSSIGKNGGISINKDFNIENYVLSNDEKQLIKNNIRQYDPQVSRVINKIC